MRFFRAAATQAQTLDPGTAMGEELMEMAEPSAAELPQPAARAMLNARASTSDGQLWRRQLPAADTARMRELSVAVAEARRAQLDQVRSTASAFAGQLVLRGYTYAAIARAAKVTPQTVATWSSRATSHDLAGVVEDPPHDEPLTVGLSPTERNPVLAQDADRLVELQLRVLDTPMNSAARSELDLLCAQLRRRGYTLQAIAFVLDVTREVVRQRVERVPEQALIGIEAEVSRNVPERELLQRVRQKLTDEEVARALHLMPVAARRRAPTPPDSETGRAFTEFMDILFAGEDRGVTAYTMAQQLGVTTGAIRFRMERVRGNLPPSMRPSVPDGTTPRDPLEGLEEQIGQLRHLAGEATIRAGHGAHDQERAAAPRDFDAALFDLVVTRGVPLRPVAEAVGRSRSALAMRLADFQRAVDGDPAADDEPGDDLAGAAMRRLMRSQAPPMAALSPPTTSFWGHSGRVS